MLIGRLLGGTKGSCKGKISLTNTSSVFELLSWLQMVSLVLATCKMPPPVHETSITTVAAVLGYVTSIVATQQNETWRRKGRNFEQSSAEQSWSCLQWNSSSCFQQGSRFIQPHPVFLLNTTKYQLVQPKMKAIYNFVMASTAQMKFIVWRIVHKVDSECTKLLF